MPERHVRLATARLRRHGSLLGRHLRQPGRRLPLRPHELLLAGRSSRAPDPSCCSPCGNGRRRHGPRREPAIRPTRRSFRAPKTATSRSPSAGRTAPSAATKWWIRRRALRVRVVMTATRCPAVTPCIHRSNPRRVSAQLHGSPVPGSREDPADGQPRSARPAHAAHDLRRARLPRQGSDRRVDRSFRRRSVPRLPRGRVDRRGSALRQIQICRQGPRSSPAASRS